MNGIGLMIIFIFHSIPADMFFRFIFYTVFWLKVSKWYNRIKSWSLKIFFQKDESFTKEFLQMSHTFLFSIQSNCLINWKLFSWHWLLKYFFRIIFLKKNRTFYKSLFFKEKQHISHIRFFIFVFHRRQCCKYACILIEMFENFLPCYSASCSV